MWVCVCVCVFVATKMILVAAPANDSLQYVTLQALVYHILPPEELCQSREARLGARVCVCVNARVHVCIYVPQVCPKQNVRRREKLKKKYKKIGICFEQ